VNPPTQSFETPGGELTAREIAHQPDVWLDVAALVERERARLDAFLAPALANPRIRVLLTGAGTSSYIGACLAPALSRQLGLRVEAVATTDLVSGPHLYLQRDVPTLLVSFARSGSSPESVAATDLAQRALEQVHHLVITCNADGELARQLSGTANACVLVLPDSTHDRAFAMTSSFTSMMLAAALIFGAIARERVASLARACAVSLPMLQASAGDLAARRFERTVFLGSNGLQALAAEAALKMLELTDGRMVALSQSVLGFRHGPKTIVNDRTLVIVFVSNDPYTRAYDLDLLDELRREARAALIVAVGTGAMGDARLELAGMAGACDLELALVDVVYAQCLGLRQSLQLGITPDNPNAAGTVSRVVKGVRIHAWKESGPSVLSDRPG
jgi:tagatose-6-phosphate ketose/aldose isomerase